MSSRWYAEFPERKLSKTSSAKGKRQEAGESPRPGRVEERTAKWPKPGPMPGVGFNRTTKMPVVKTRPAKGGVD